MVSSHSHLLRVMHKQFNLINLPTSLLERPICGKFTCVTTLDARTEGVVCPLSFFCGEHRFFTNPQHQDHYTINFIAIMGKLNSSTTKALKAGTPPQGDTQREYCRRNSIPIADEAGIPSPTHIKHFNEAARQTAVSAYYNMQRKKRDPTAPTPPATITDSKNIASVNNSATSAQEPAGAPEETPSKQSGAI